MSRRNTRAPRDILYQEDYPGDFEDVSAYLDAKDPTRYNRKVKRDERGSKKKVPLRKGDFELPDPDILPMKKKIRGRIPDSEGERFF
ncbi:MAG: hypothetical protein Q7J09_02745 [Methanocalculus sp.]|uniref:hypothetical protein n=1 Tax=Methanocalculus sp. TaxID=2004547 RepID=UPI00271AA8AD|nr:hypothetical protein [Methanocalculus sp.]MDO8842559.1 hypothetical protein [Methanocalculus sp.]MDO9538908.1 hypothetical protein [Methanocalculus sp.]